MGAAWRDNGIRQVPSRSLLLLPAVCGADANANEEGLCTLHEEKTRSGSETVTATER